MAAKKQIATKKVVIPKRPVVAKTKAVGRPATKPSAAVKPAQSKAPAVKPKAAPKKSVPAPRAPSLVNAVPMSSIAPQKIAAQKPEQLLYEPAATARSDPPPDSAPEQSVKRGRGRHRANSGEVAPRVPPSDVSEAPPIHRAPSPQAARAVAATPVSRLTGKRRGFRLSRRVIVSVVALIILIAGGLWWHGARAADAASANAKLVAEISKRAVLPRGETPSVTTVVDETKLNQEFLRNAKKGDKVLLYFQSSEAVVYRPSTGQIVNMGPLQTPRPRVFIRQGSNTDNVGAVKTIVGRTSDFLVASQDQSPRKDYSQTIVVDLTGNRPDLAGQLAQLLHVNVGPLPAGEIPPDADLMVLVGSDYH